MTIKRMTIKRTLTMTAIRTITRTIIITITMRMVMTTAQHAASEAPVAESPSDTTAAAPVGAAELPAEHGQDAASRRTPGRAS